MTSPGMPDRSVAAPGTHRLPPSVLNLWHIQTVLTALALTATVIVAVQWWDHPLGHQLFWPALGLVVFFGLVDIVFGNALRHRHYSYTVTGDEVYVAKGLFVRHTMDIAVPQVLSIHVVSGPLQRVLGLASVRFTCVVEGESLGPVGQREAERIKRIVLDGLEQRRPEAARPATVLPAPDPGISEPGTADVAGEAGAVGSVSEVRA
jgi:uncharacterized protein